MVAAAAKINMPENITKKSLECALQTWFGNARDRGAGGRKLTSKDSAVPERQDDSNLDMGTADCKLLYTQLSSLQAMIVVVVEENVNV